MENKKLTMREMICYGIGDITANVYLQFIALFAIVFYTDVLGISATLAGLIFMGSRVFDGINDIAVGYISDRYGHYKRWILYGRGLCHHVHEFSSEHENAVCIRPGRFLLLDFDVYVLRDSF